MTLPRYLLFLDTETTGKYVFGYGYNIDFSKYPRSSYMCQLSWRLIDREEKWRVIDEHDYLIRPHGYHEMPSEAEIIHKLSYARLITNGHDASKVISGPFFEALRRCDGIVAHNASFDIKMILTSSLRVGCYDSIHDLLTSKKIYCTKKNCKLYVDARDRLGRRKFPRLEEVYKKVFDRSIVNAHDASYDVAATAEICMALADTIQWKADHLL